MQKLLLKFLWFLSGLVVGFTALSITRAAVPMRGFVTDDTAIYQRLSEIHVKKQAKIDFDSDIVRLSKLEKQYKEKLPSLANLPQLKPPMQRAQQSYHLMAGSRLSSLAGKAR
jgi:hypothetical protein